MNNCIPTHVGIQFKNWTAGVAEMLTKMGFGGCRSFSILVSWRFLMVLIHAVPLVTVPYSVLLNWYNTSLVKTYPSTNELF